jgi:serine/threonine-protein kinase
MTETGAIFGSPAYMSPEQLRSTKSVDFRTDIWSLGVLLYELLIGEGPFAGSSAFACLAAVAADDPRPPRLLRPDLPGELEAVILACLQKNRNLRVNSVAELARRLRPFAAGAEPPDATIVARRGEASGKPATQFASPAFHADVARAASGVPSVRPWHVLVLAAVFVLAAVVAVYRIRNVAPQRRQQAASLTRAPPRPLLIQSGSHEPSPPATTALQANGDVPPAQSAPLPPARATGRPVIVTATTASGAPPGPAPMADPRVRARN